MPRRKNIICYVCLVALLLLFCSLTHTHLIATEEPSWPVLLEDHFDSRAAEWPACDNPNLKIGSKNGQFEIYCKSDGIIVRVPFPSPKACFDFSVELAISFTAGEGEAGIFFRFIDGDNHYFFSVSSAGRYRISKVQSGRYWPLVEWTPCPELLKNARNHLKIVGQGSRFSFFVNENLLCRVNEESFRAGTIHLYAAISNMPPFMVQFDDLVLRVDLDLQHVANQVSSCLALGKTRIQDERFSDAITLFDEAFQILATKLTWNKKYVETTLLLAQTYAALHDYLSAINYYRKTLSIVRDILDREMEADVLRELGEAYSATGDFPKALGNLEQALAIYNECSRQKKVIMTLIDLGELYVSFGDYDRAKHQYTTAKTESEKINDPHEKANAFLGLAGCYCNTGDYRNAVVYYRTAISIFQTANDTPGRIKAFVQLGDCHFAFGDNEAAKESFAAATDLAKTIGKWQTQARALLGLGRCELLSYNPNNALALFQQALNLFRNGKDRGGEGQTLIDISQYYVILGKYDRATELLAVASSLLAQTGATRTLIQCKNYLGHCLWALGDYSRALYALEDALGLAKTIGWLPGQAISLLMIGVCQTSLKEQSAAINTYQQALAIFCQLKNSRGEAAVSSNLGLLLASTGQYESAIHCYNDALAFYRKGSDCLNEAYILLNLGSCLDNLGEYPKAAVCFQDARALFREAEDIRGEATALLELASSAYLSKSYNDAIMFYYGCLQLICPFAAEDFQTCNRSIAWRGYNGLGLTLLEQGEGNEAAETWKVAIAIVEQMRANLTRAGSKLCFMRGKSDLYDNLVSLLFSQYAFDNALSYAERAKARTLVDMMETAMVSQNDVLPPDVQSASHVLKELSGLQAAAGESILVGTYDHSEISSSLALAVRWAQEEYMTILATLEREYPELGETLSVDPEHLWQHFEYVRGELGPGTVALEYFVTNDATIVWVITEEGVQTASRIAITRDELSMLVRSFREKIEDQPALGQEAISYLSALEKGRDLYELLIAPVEAYLTGATHLVIVPSDVLFYLPFGALVNCPGCEGRDLYGGEFLIESYSISYAPSISSLYWPFQHHGNGTYESVLAVGADPDPLYPLKYSAEEALAVSASFPHADLLLKQQCTEEEIKLKLQQKTYDVIHLSTHGRFDPILPLLSQVQFLPSASEDGALHAGEILGLDLAGSLVVLSACQTALPPELTEESAGLVIGDEIQGLGQALFTAGASSVILTLWNVNDCSTSELMKKMYQELRDGAEKGEALRQAQLFLLGDPMYRHPCYWAPFVLYGDWR